VQGLPIIKPPYDRITAYDMNTGNRLWQKTHSSTPDNIKNNAALKGLDLPRLGQPGRTFIGVLTTRSLVVAGEGGVHTNAQGQTVALLRAYDKSTGEDIPGEVNMPAKRRVADVLHAQRQAVHLIAVSGQGTGAEILICAAVKPASRILTGRKFFMSSTPFPATGLQRRPHCPPALVWSPSRYPNSCDRGPDHAHLHEFPANDTPLDRNLFDPSFKSRSRIYEGIYEPGSRLADSNGSQGCRDEIRKLGVPVIVLREI
jgi:hypothetical protein